MADTTSPKANAVAPKEKNALTRGAATRLGMMGMLATGTTLGAACNNSSSVLTPQPAKAATSTDAQIIGAAATAEALASVMYDNIIKMSPAYKKLGALNNLNDQAYLAAGRQQEAIHYSTLVGIGAKPLAMTFYFPTGMFSDATFATTVNTLTLLEDAFIAAYLIGIRDLSANSSKQLAGQILGVESEHRAFARVIASDLGLGSTTGLSGVAEPTNGLANAANNLAFERTFANKFSTIGDIVTALTPFISGTAPGFDKTPFAFNTTANFYLSQTPIVALANTTP